MSTMTPIDKPSDDIRCHGSTSRKLSPSFKIGNTWKKGFLNKKIINNKISNKYKTSSLPSSSTSSSLLFLEDKLTGNEDGTLSKHNARNYSFLNDKCEESPRLLSELNLETTKDRSHRNLASPLIVAIDSNENRNDPHDDFNGKKIHRSSNIDSADETINTIPTSPLHVSIQHDILKCSSNESQNRQNNTDNDFILREVHRKTKKNDQIYINHENIPYNQPSLILEYDDHIHSKITNTTATLTNDDNKNPITFDSNSNNTSNTTHIHESSIISPQLATDLSILLENLKRKEKLIYKLKYKFQSTNEKNDDDKKHTYYKAVEKELNQYSHLLYSFTESYFPISITTSNYSIDRMNHNEDNHTTANNTNTYDINLGHCQIDSNNQEAINLNFILENILDVIASYSKERDLCYKYVFSSDLAAPSYNCVSKVSSFLSCTDSNHLYPPVIQLGHHLLVFFSNTNRAKILWETLFQRDETINIRETVHETTSRRERLQLLGACLLLKITIYSNLNDLLDGQYCDKEVNKSCDDTSIEGEVYYNTCQRPKPNMEKQDHRHSLTYIYALLRNVLPMVINKIDDHKRTLLSTICMDTSICVFEYCARILRNLYHGVDKKISNVYDAFWDGIPLLKKLLNIQYNWNFNDNNHSGNSMYNTCCKECTMDVINDWKGVIEKAELEYNRSLLNDVDERNVEQINAISLICDELCGISVSPNENDHDPIPLLFGMISQTICKDISHPRKKLNTSNIILAFECALSFISKKRSNNGIVDDYDEAAVFRSIVACLGRGKIALHKLDEEKYNRILDLSFFMLRSSSGRCLSYITKILNLCWSVTDGLPADFLEQNDDNNEEHVIPKSFTTLMKELRDESEFKHHHSGDSEAIICPSKQVICNLLTVMIMRKPDKLLPIYLSSKSTDVGYVYVLLKILEKRHLEGSPDKQTYASYDCVGKRILELLKANNYVQRRLNDKPYLLLNLDLNVIIRELIFIMEQETYCDNAKSASSRIFGEILKEKAFHHSEKIVDLIIDETLEKNNTDANDKDPKFLKYASSWRKTLLEYPFFQNGYSKLLYCIGKKMFEMPSNTLPLSLFGAFVGNEQSMKEWSPNFLANVKEATTVILKLALDTIQEPCQDITPCDVDVFRTLSPLLLLRRLPRSYCIAIRTDSSPDSLTLLDSLEAIIGSKLGLELNFEIDNKSQIQTSEEKRLLAEIGSRMFGSKFIKRFCLVLFRIMLKNICTTKLSSSMIDRCKIAMYIVYHFVQISGMDIDDEECLSESIYFALIVIHHHHINNIPHSSNLEDNFIKLQTGCMDFLAICLEVYSLNGAYQSTPKKICLIEEVYSTPLGKPAIHTNGVKVYKYLSALTETMISLITTSKTPTNSIIFKIDDSLHWSVPARTCLLNSFILLSQRYKITEENRRNHILTKVIPLLLDWLLANDIDDELHDPLCNAACLQLIFNVITTTKSLSYLKKSQTSFKDSIRQAFQFCVELLSRSYPIKENKYAQERMRVAALKLLLAIVSFDISIENENDVKGTSNTECSIHGHLYPGDLGRAFSILNGAANVDDSAEVRKLAGSIVAILQRS